MNITISGKNKNIAVVGGGEIVITDAQSALDLAMTVKYETGCSRIMIDKASVNPDFFRLGTGLAGEILQKYANYRIKLAVVGDFSVYKSKPLQDFFYESNNGRDFFFVPTYEQAEKMLDDAGE